MSSDWGPSTLGEFVRLQRGHDLTAEEQRPGQYPVMGSAGPNGSHDVAKAKGPGVVVGRSGASMGRVHYCASDYWPHNTCLYVTDFMGNNPRFAYYLLQSLNLAAYNSGSAQPSLNRNYIYSMPIRTPARKTQDRIEAFLSALDDRIILLRETNATLEAIAQALFKSWFVDFDPVRAKRDGRAPEGLDEATAALFPGSFEESELGEVPNGWKAMPLAEAYALNPTRKLSKGASAPYLDMANVPTKGFGAADVSTRDFGSGTKFMAGDTLLARITPCLENGKSAFVDFLEDAQVGWGSTEFVVLRPKAPLPAFHAYLLCRHQPFRDHAIQSMSGTSGRQRIQNDVLGRYLLAVPPEPVGATFGELVKSLQARATANNSLARTLSTVRDTLLPHLISGQLRLPEAAETLDEALA